MDSEVMSIVRGRLIKASPWLASVFGRLIPEERTGLVLPGTDGTRFLYDPEWLKTHLREGSAVLLHCCAHGLLGHLQLRDPNPLAVDLAATLLADNLLPEYCPAHGTELFMQARHHLAEVPLDAVADAMAGNDFFKENRAALQALLALDDHSLWTSSPAVQPKAGNGWEELRSGVLNGSRRGRAPGGEKRRYTPGAVPNRNYRSFLSSYVETREELREDLDAFDRNLYAYGLERYGNMPLIEPPETRESRHIDELAIVIDTSGSCLRTLTERFLDETRALLADETLFARRFNLRLIQCDARVRRDDAITTLQDFERAIETLHLIGGGGTDFRPAFERIDRLIARGTFRHLRAALFFSDGMGIFPPVAPEYDAIFVFFEGRYDDIDVPPWVKKLVLKESIDEHT